MQERKQEGVSTNDTIELTVEVHVHNTRHSEQHLVRAKLECSTFRWFVHRQRAHLRVPTPSRLHPPRTHSATACPQRYVSVAPAQTGCLPLVLAAEHSIPTCEFAHSSAGTSYRVLVHVALHDCMLSAVRPRMMTRQMG